MIGRQLGSYRIDSLLGSGGMGEVYRARDTTLERDVAVKLLPALASDDPQRRTRLLREARAAASLNHPNICTIHEVGEAEGRAYIAMEVVEGESLSKRVAERPLPAGELVRFGVQLADAVAHAHERGIVHRDLKSSNVMITPEGRVKVLDFGLAKSLGGEELADLSTHADLSLTEPGAVVGTLPYMAPEQLRGVPADARSDIWALGVVLHEMAAGARPFTGRTGYEMSSAILHEPPPPLPARVPAPVQAVIRRCLEKEPARRYQRAIEIDPTYALPYAALSSAYETAGQTSLMPPRDTFPKAKAAALKAIELDEQLADAHAALAEVYLWHDWNWAGAKREVDRALQLSPDAVEALIASLDYLVLAAGRPDESARTSQRILAVDPLNPFSRVQTIWTAFFSRRHDDSIRNANSLLEVWPNNVMAPFFLAANYGVKKQRAEVRVECEKILAALAGAYNMQVLANCAWSYGVAGDTDEARRLLRIVEHPPAGEWLDPAVMSNAYGAVGDIDRAIEWCRKGLEERAPNMVYMKVGPAWDPIRADPRFQTMFREMNFPQ